MSRELSDRDKEIIGKLVPEIQEILRPDSGIELEYSNILPPVANHHSRDEKDFSDRIGRLTSEEIKYLYDRITEGSESLGCLQPEFAEAFFRLLEDRVSSKAAEEARAAYESGEC